MNLLLEDKEVNDIPILVLANKIDVTPHLGETEIIRGLNLDYVVENPWAAIPISALHGTNFDQVIEWLLKQKKVKK